MAMSSQVYHTHMTKNPRTTGTDNDLIRTDKQFLSAEPVPRQTGQNDQLDKVYHLFDAHK